MTREQILERLLLNIGEGIWMMAALKMSPKPISKERLKDLTNKHYMLKYGEDSLPPIRSRHMLDQMTARLEGAGLVEVYEVARARMYELSELGHEIIKFREQYLQQREG